MQPVRPFLKWAGAKTKLVAAIRAAAAFEPQRVIEPFVGSGAVALNLGCSRNVLADANPDLIGVYAALQEDGESFIRACEALFSPETNRASVYYALREEFNATSDTRRKACLFVYLNRHGYNGLCRYNGRGGFNVPFGRYVQPRLPRTAMESFAALLQKCTLRCDDFRTVLADAGEADLVYCDPPYVPASATANFTAYARGGFGSRDQIELAEHCRQAAQRGAWVIISNHDTAETRELYRGAHECRALSVARRISCVAAGRSPARELLVVYRPAIFAKAV